MTSTLEPREGAGLSRQAKNSVSSRTPHGKNPEGEKKWAFEGPKKCNMTDTSCVASRDEGREWRVGLRQ